MTRQRASPSVAATPTAARVAGSSAPVVTASAPTAQAPIAASSQDIVSGRPSRWRTITTAPANAKPTATSWKPCAGPELVGGARGQRGSEQHARDAAVVPEHGRSNANEARSDEHPSNHQELSKQHAGRLANGPVYGLIISNSSVTVA